MVQWIFGSKTITLEYCTTWQPTLMHWCVIYLWGTCLVLSWRFNLCGHFRFCLFGFIFSPSQIGHFWCNSNLSAWIALSMAKNIARMKLIKMAPHCTKSNQTVMAFPMQEKRHINLKSFYQQNDNFQLNVITLYFYISEECSIKWLCSFGCRSIRLMYKRQNQKIDQSYANGRVNEIYTQPAS